MRRYPRHRYPRHRYPVRRYAYPARAPFLGAGAGPGFGGNLPGVRCVGAAGGRDMAGRGGSRLFRREPDDGLFPRQPGLCIGPCLFLKAPQIARFQRRYHADIRFEWRGRIRGVPLAVGRWKIQLDAIRKRYRQQLRAGRGNVVLRGIGGCERAVPLSQPICELHPRIAGGRGGRGTVPGAGNRRGEARGGARVHPGKLFVRLHQGGHDHARANARY